MNIREYANRELKLEKGRKNERNAREEIIAVTCEGEAGILEKVDVAVNIIIIINININIIITGGGSGSRRGRRVKLVR